MGESIKVRNYLGISIDDCQELMEYVNELEIPYEDFWIIIRYAKQFQQESTVYIGNNLLFEIIKESLVGYDYCDINSKKEFVNCKKLKSTVNRAINIMVK